MRATLQTSSSDTAPETRRRSETNGPAIEAYPDDSAVELRNDDQISLSTSASVAKPELPEARRPLKYQQQEQSAATVCHCYYREIRIIIAATTPRAQIHTLLRLAAAVHFFTRRII